MKPGDIVYYIENGDISQAEVIRISRDFVTLRYDIKIMLSFENPEYILNGGFRIQRRRVYATREEAQEVLKQRRRH